MSDEIHIAESQVGWGELGTLGRLGYDDAFVTRDGVFYRNAISAHGPSVVRLRLEGAFTRFEVFAGFNDTARGHEALASFRIDADGRELFVSRMRSPEEPPLLIVLDVAGVSELALKVQVVDYSHCQAVWFEPTLSTASLERRARIRSKHEIATR